MMRTASTHMEVAVLVGEQKLPTRLIIEMLPQNEVQRRLSKANREAEKKGRKLTTQYKSRARLNLFLTNIPVEWVATQQVRKLYRIRWQIELRFKAWKSYYRIDAIKKMNHYRFECYIYSTLLHLMINLEIASNFFSILWKHTSKPLSLLKFYKTTSQYIFRLRNAIIKQGIELINYITFLYEISHDKLITEKRKNHSGGLCEILTTKTIV